MFRINPVLKALAAAVSMLAFGLLVPVAADAAAPTTLYVTGGGTNNPGCPSTNPCATITYAISQAGPNPTIIVSGTIDDNVVIGTPVGTSITITGAGAVKPADISGAGSSPVITVNGALAVSLVDLTITKGSGGIYNKGGNLTLTGDTVSGNGTSTNGSGGIFSSGGNISILESAISANVDESDGGGIHASKGTITTVTDSTISANLAVNSGTCSSACGGGGIYTNDTLHILDSTIANNTASNHLCIGSPAGNTFVLGYCGGGGLFIGADGVASATDSTIAANEASDTECEDVSPPLGPGRCGGGGIFTLGSFTAIASTISGNRASNSICNGDTCTTGGIVLGADGTAAFGATIIALNGSGNCFWFGPAPTSFGYNLSNDLNSKYCNLTSSSDLLDKDPDLGALTSNGGPTLTMLPALVSPATDIIPTGTALNKVLVCPGTDQRGYARPGVGQSECTIGAVEPGGTTNPSTTTVTVSPTSVALGAAVTYSATVAPQSGSGTPTGSVTFTVGPTTLCTATLSSGVGACAVKTAPLGTDSVTGTYSGDSIFAGSTGTTILKVGTTRTRLVSSASTAKTGEAVIFTAIITPVPNGGTVQFTSGSKAIAGCTVIKVSTTTGKAKCTNRYSTAGTFRIQAVYSGDATFAKSTSAVLTENIT